MKEDRRGGGGRPHREHRCGRHPAPGRQHARAWPPLLVVLLLVMLLLPVVAAVAGGRRGPRGRGVAPAPGRGRWPERAPGARRAPGQMPQVVRQVAKRLPERVQQRVWTVHGWVAVVGE